MTRRNRDHNRRQNEIMGRYLLSAGMAFGIMQVRHSVHSWLTPNTNAMIAAPELREQGNFPIYLSLSISPVMACCCSGTRCCCWWCWISALSRSLSFLDFPFFCLIRFSITSASVGFCSPAPLTSFPWTYVLCYWPVWPPWLVCKML